MKYLEELRRPSYGNGDSSSMNNDSYGGRGAGELSYYGYGNGDRYGDGYGDGEFYGYEDGNGRGHGIDYGVGFSNYSDA